MNRAERRRQERQQRQQQTTFAVLSSILQHAEDDGACPDCNADLRVIADSGLVQVVVEHDDSCPTFQEMRR